jgi:regulator of replication initiation timing
MPQVKVSGVPYTINVTPNFNTIQEAIDWYEEQIAILEQENKGMRARMNRLEEENQWLESLNIKIQQGRI